jgi:arginine/serine-rich splicing factor 4/5/6
MSESTEIVNSRAIFVGNCQNDDQEHLVSLFISKGLSVISCDMKLGFAFVYCQISDNLSDAIQEINGQSLPGGKPLSVAFAKGGEVREKESIRRAKQVASKTLFIVGFDPSKTSSMDIKDVFSEFGKINNIEMKKNFAFVEFDNIEDTKPAIERYHQKECFGRTISVEYGEKKTPKPYSRDYNNGYFNNGGGYNNRNYDSRNDKRGGYNNNRNYDNIYDNRSYNNNRNYDNRGDYRSNNYNRNYDNRSDNRCNNNRDYDNRNNNTGYNDRDFGPRMPDNERRDERGFRNEYDRGRDTNRIERPYYPR